MSEYRDDKIVQTEQIDLIELVMTIWDGKFKVIGISLIFLFSMIGYNYVSPLITITATTEIKPINSVEANKYNSLDAVGFFTITPELILDLYIEKLEDRFVFEKSMKKYQFLDQKEYESVQSYDLAVRDLAYSIEIKPVDDSHYEIIFEHDNMEKWELVQKNVHELANEHVRQSLIELFNSALNKAKQRRDFEIEDISIKIENAKADYYRSTSSKLAFLTEQKEIAIVSNIPTSTFEEMTIGLNVPSTEGVNIAPASTPTAEDTSAPLPTAEDTYISYVMKDIPYYFRGYVPITKEIELIQARENIEAFIPQLILLESQMREYEQDKQFNRGEKIFSLSPIADPKNFKSVLFLYDGTIFEIKSRFSLFLLLATLSGAIIGIFYVALSDAINKRKAQINREH